MIRSIYAWVQATTPGKTVRQLNHELRDRGSMPQPVRRATRLDSARCVWEVIKDFRLRQGSAKQKQRKPSFREALGDQSWRVDSRLQ